VVISQVSPVAYRGSALNKHALPRVRVRHRRAWATGGMWMRLTIMKRAANKWCSMAKKNLFLYENRINEKRKMNAASLKTTA
jgi:hypothetical protein